MQVEEKCRTTLSKLVNRCELKKNVQFLVFSWIHEVRERKSEDMVSRDKNWCHTLTLLRETQPKFLLYIFPLFFCYSWFPVFFFFSIILKSFLAFFISFSTRKHVFPFSESKKRVCVFYNRNKSRYIFSRGKIWICFLIMFFSHFPRAQKLPLMKFEILF